MINSELIEYTWHDAVLLSVYVDRASAGQTDSIILSVQSRTGQRLEVRFGNCYALCCEMNFGVVAAETIRSFSELDNCEDAAKLRRGLSWLGSKLSQVKYFRLETNSTASVILVAAIDIEVCEL